MTDFLPHVYGQEKVKKAWKRLLEERRLPHTMILYGDEGLGKTTAAFDLAGVLTGKSEKLWEEIRLWQRESSGKEPVVTFADHQVSVSSSDGDGAQDRAVPPVSGRDGNIR